MHGKKRRGISSRRLLLKRTHAAKGARTAEHRQHACMHAAPGMQQAGSEPAFMYSPPRPTSVATRRVAFCAWTPSSVSGSTFFFLYAVTLSGRRGSPSRAACERPASRAEAQLLQRIRTKIRAPQLHRWSPYRPAWEPLLAPDIAAGDPASCLTNTRTRARGCNATRQRFMGAPKPRLLKHQPPANQHTALPHFSPEEAAGELQDATGSR